MFLQKRLLFILFSNFVTVSSPPAKRMFNVLTGVIPGNDRYDVLLKGTNATYTPGYTPSLGEVLILPYKFISTGQLEWITAAIDKINGTIYPSYTYNTRFVVHETGSLFSDLVRPNLEFTSYLEIMPPQPSQLVILSVRHVDPRLNSKTVFGGWELFTVMVQDSAESVGLTHGDNYHVVRTWLDEELQKRFANSLNELQREKLDCLLGLGPNNLLKPLDANEFVFLSWDMDNNLHLWMSPGMIVSVPDSPLDLRNLEAHYMELDKSELNFSTSHAEMDKGSPQYKCIPASESAGELIAIVLQGNQNTVMFTVMENPSNGELIINPQLETLEDYLFFHDIQATGDFSESRRIFLDPALFSSDPKPKIICLDTKDAKLLEYTFKKETYYNWRYSYNLSLKFETAKFSVVQCNFSVISMTGTLVSKGFNVSTGLTQLNNLDGKYVFVATMALVLVAVLSVAVYCEYKRR